MLNKPKFLSPNTNATECVVDTKSSVDFSFIVDGNEPIISAKVVVYDLLTGQELWSYEVTRENHSDVFDNNGFFYPVNEKNENNIFKFSTILSGVSNRTEPYYWDVEVKSSTGNTVKSSPATFYANSAPKLTIKCSEKELEFAEIIEGAILNDRSCKFKGEYVQDEGVNLKRYGWRLIDVNSGDVLIDTTSHNQIYGTIGNILCDYNGLVTGNEYSIELYVETQNGYVTITNPVKFKVEYNVKTLITDFNVETIKSSSCIMLDWGNLKTTEGVVEGENITYLKNYPITSYSQVTDETGDVTTVETGKNSIRLDGKSKIIFEGNANSELAISEESYIVLSFQITKNEDMTLFEAQGVDDYLYNVQAKLKYISKSHTLLYMVSKENGDYAETSFVINVPKSTTWCIVTLHPLLREESGVCCVNMDVVESYANNALYPDSDKYPGALYPNNGTWDK